MILVYDACNQTKNIYATPSLLIIEASEISKLQEKHFNSWRLDSKLPLLILWACYVCIWKSYLSMLIMTYAKILEFHFINLKSFLHVIVIITVVNH